MTSLAPLQGDYILVDDTKVPPLSTFVDLCKKLGEKDRFDPEDPDEEPREALTSCVSKSAIDCLAYRLGIQIDSIAALPILLKTVELMLNGAVQDQSGYTDSGESGIRESKAARARFAELDERWSKAVQDARAVSEREDWIAEDVQHVITKSGQQGTSFTAEFFRFASAILNTSFVYEGPLDGFDMRKGRYEIPFQSIQSQLQVTDPLRTLARDFDQRKWVTKARLSTLNALSITAAALIQIEQFNEARKSASRALSVLDELCGTVMKQKSSWSPAQARHDIKRSASKARSLFEASIASGLSFEERRGQLNTMMTACDAATTSLGQLRQVRDAPEVISGDEVTSSDNETEDGTTVSPGSITDDEEYPSPDTPRDELISDEEHDKAADVGFALSGDEAA